MKVTFANLNNNDTEHNIVFLSLTLHAGGGESITVLLDCTKYTAPVMFDSQGNRSFKHCGKVYDFVIE